MYQIGFQLSIGRVALRAVSEGWVWMDENGKMFPEAWPTLARAVTAIRSKKRLTKLDYDQLVAMNGIESRHLEREASPAEEIITVSGWYLAANGCFTFYQWRNGILEQGVTVTNSWLYDQFELWEEQKANMPSPSWEIAQDLFGEEELNELNSWVREFTSFKSLAGISDDSCMNYKPSLNLNGKRGKILAKAYNRLQEAKGDPRRVVE